MSRMDVTATVKIRAADGSDNQPDRDRVERAAGLLKEQGFTIQRIGRFGVSVTGSDDHFSRVLGVKAAPGEALVAPVKTDKPELGELLEHVEVVPKPNLY